MKRFLNITFLLIVVQSFGQFESPQAKLNRNSMMIGEQALLDLSVKSYEPIDVEFITQGDTLRGGIEILKKAELDTIKQNQEYLYTQQLAITCFDTGFIAINPVQVKLGTDTLETNALLLNVRMIDADTTLAIKDIKEIYKEPYTNWEKISQWFNNNWKTITIVGLGIISLIFILIMILRKNKEEEEITEPTLPLQERIMLAFRELEEKKLWQNGRIKTYYVELTDILREYIEKRFNVNTFEKTTDEIMSSMRLVVIDPQQKEKLQKILLLADLVKFAKEKPGGYENEDCLRLSKAFVIETKLEQDNTKENVQ